GRHLLSRISFGVRLMPHGYAQQKFFEALRALVIQNKPLKIRLTLAADALIGLQLDQLPEAMRDDFQQLKRDLMRTPLRLPDHYHFMPREVTPREASRLAEKMLDMYTTLLGGLTKAHRRRRRALARRQDHAAQRRAHHREHLSSG